MTVTVSDEHIQAWRQIGQRQAKKNAEAAQRAREALPKLVALLREQYGATRIILFGSLARGRFTTDSDIDLAVAGIEPGRFFFALGDLIGIAPCWVDLKPLEALEPHFLERVLKTGEELP